MKPIFYSTSSSWSFVHKQFNEVSKTYLSSLNIFVYRLTTVTFNVYTIFVHYNISIVTKTDQLYLQYRFIHRYIE